MNLFKKISQIIIYISDCLYKPFAKIIPQEMFRYGFTGGLNMCLDIFLFYILYNFIFKQQFVSIAFITMNAHIAAFVFVFPFTFTTGFLLAKYVTFTNSHLKSQKQLFRYAVSVMGSIILHYILLKFFVDYLGIWGTVSKIYAVAIVTVYSFSVQKFYSFK